MNRRAFASCCLWVALSTAGCLTDAWEPCAAAGCAGRDAGHDTQPVDSSPGDAPRTDAPPPTGDGGLVLRHAGIGTLGGMMTSGGLTLHGASFEGGGRSCIGLMCVEGGISP